jgi:hypothetical protein
MKILIFFKFEEAVVIDILPPALLLDLGGRVI